MKTSFSHWSFEENLQRALTMGGCINKHGGLKTSCAWPARFMSRVYGERWQLLSFNTSSLRRGENLARRDSRSSLVVHLRLKCVLPPSSWKPTWRLKKHGAEWFFSDPECSSLGRVAARFTSSATALSPHSSQWVQASRLEGTTIYRGAGGGGRGTLGCPPVLTD